jgi:Anti-sigma-28 factor, FlgM
MKRAACDDDTFPMTVLALRTATCHPRQEALESTVGGRFGRDRVSSQMPESGKTKVEEIRARLERGTYVVDAAKVADAIVERLLEGRSVRETGRAN